MTTNNFFEDALKLEKELFKDVEAFAKQINTERREKINLIIHTRYPDTTKKEYFINELNLRVSTQKNIKNGSLTGCA